MADESDSLTPFTTDAAAADDDVSVSVSHTLVSPATRTCQTLPLIQTLPLMPTRGLKFLLAVHWHCIALGDPWGTLGLPQWAE